MESSLLIECVVVYIFIDTDLGLFSTKWILRYLCFVFHIGIRYKHPTCFCSLSLTIIIELFFDWTVCLGQVSVLF